MNARSLASLSAVPVLLSGCIFTCMNDVGCFDGAHVATGVRGAGPFIVTLCVEGVCTEPMSTADRGDRILELPEGPASVYAYLATDDAGERLLVDVNLRAARIASGTVHDYTLRVEDADATILDEAFEVTYSGYHPGGEFCPGEVCRRANVSL